MDIGEDEKRKIHRIEPFELPGEITPPAPSEPKIEPAPAEEPVTVPA